MPQLNPEFFISQLFWLFISFSFLFIFLWRISLPRIGIVIEKRANKISEDIKYAKEFQAEAEEIQNKIYIKLRQAKLDTSDLIKDASNKLQSHTAIELEKVDIKINKKLEDTALEVQKNKMEAFDQINNQIYNITKLTLSKISDIKAEDSEIKNIVKNIQEKVIN